MVAKADNEKVVEQIFSHYIAVCTCGSKTWHIALDSLTPGEIKEVSFVCTECEHEATLDLDPDLDFEFELEDDEEE